MANEEERFVSRVKKTDSCWIWQGKAGSAGYGRMQVNGRETMVHRFAYERSVGPIPEGLTIDHLCSVRNCVNPDHLEAVTRGENSRRGIIKKGLKTHCSRGHDLSENRRYTQRGDYYCLACGREVMRDLAKRKKEARAG